MRPRTTPENEAKICRLYAAGMTITAVGKAVGVWPGTVHKVLMRHEVKTRPVGYRGDQRFPLAKHNPLDDIDEDLM